MKVRALAALAAVLCLALPAAAAPRSSQGGDPATLKRAIAEISTSLDEGRLVDAGRMLDEAGVAGLKSPQLTVLSGELDLLENRPKDALQSFKDAEGFETTRARALEGEGLALMALGDGEEAVKTLLRAVEAAPGAWRAWNALGCAYDDRRAFDDAEHAYGEALKSTTKREIVLNNRGFSRLLQHRPKDAVPDLAEALRRKPDFEAARTNLRLALALSGDYDRAISGASVEDRAALLNNAGFAAAMNGDWTKAEALLQEAMKTKSVFYDKASENLDLVRAAKAKAGGAKDADPH